MIRLRHIKKSFQDKSGTNEVLRGIDLDVLEGEFVSIMGPSGAGKSLLLTGFLLAVDAGADPPGHARRADECRTVRDDRRGAQ